MMPPPEPKAPHGTAPEGERPKPRSPEDPAEDPALTRFHPATRRWFGRTFRSPTAPQRQGWEAIASGRHTLISAPTGSGKTLAAFLEALDRLLREGAERDELPAETRVVYVSPLKALSADIHRNLAEPRKGIRRSARELGLDPPKITAAVRSGDTPRSRRRKMVETPPHILVTTPESLYLYLTAARSRETLRSVETVIVDEIHAVLESRRGSHLALSLERLADVTGGPLQRIGLSATQNPIAEVARFLVGAAHVEDGPADDDPISDCEIVDEGHQQAMDLALEIPDSPLEAVLSEETRQELYARITRLIETHRTTLVFVNTRREAERVAHALTERLGPERITAHHGSLSKERRHEAENRLKEGRLDALVATASMELGIDIGYVDLVCQLGTPNRIATFVQRVGRSGHTVAGTPKGRLFPLTRDDLVQGAALLWAVRRGELDRVEIPDAPLDILSQQIVAEVACGEREEEELFRLFRRAWPYRHLSREVFREVVELISRGFQGRHGRKGRRIHYDAVNRVLKPRKGTRIAALTCGGAIPDNADYRVLKEPEGTYLGSVNEDFAIESLPGDVFQLGNTSWRLLKVETGVVRVEDARGEPPSIPFWLGEAPSRSPELSRAVSRLRQEVGARLEDGSKGEADSDPEEEGPGVNRGEEGRETAIRWLTSEVRLGRGAARQITHYLAESRRILGVLPTEDTLVLERFFDEAGGMQLVLHAPFGSRVNRAWGLALRKRFCRQFNFELQAAATEEGVLLSLGPQHSFPLEDVFRYLKPETVREILVQALLDAPMFQTRWRWVATLSLALLRWRGGRKVPPQIQRMEAEDLLSAVFPDALACLENVAGERELPNHPLVRQAVEDCLVDAMDLPRLVHLLERLHAGEFRLVARDTPEPSPLSHELVTARPYAFLDDAEAEERRTLAVRTRRALEPSTARELGRLDPAAIRRVRREAWPEPRTADELHDALLVSGVLRHEEAASPAAGPEAATGDTEGRSEGEPDSWIPWLEALAAEGRAARMVLPASASGQDGDAGPSGHFWVAAERLAEARGVWPDAAVEPDLVPPEEFHRGPANRREAVRELVRGRLEVSGPVTAGDLASGLRVEIDAVREALLALENEGTVLRGHFTPPGDEGGGREVEVGERRAEAGPGDGAAGGDGSHSGRLEWCHRRLLARIHRQTVERLRAEVRPVSARDYMRFLFRWQRLEPRSRLEGEGGVEEALGLLEGFEAPAAAWEADFLAGRCREYDPEDLDRLCSSGRIAWGRLSPPGGDGRGLRATGPLRSSPVALWPRENTARWLRLAPRDEALQPGPHARKVLEVLDREGASFFPDLVARTGLLPTRVEAALGELVAFGLVTSDGFSGLRALLTPSDKRRPVAGPEGRPSRRRGAVPYGVDTAGRWSLLRPGEGADPPGDTSPEVEAEFFARVLLRRYGVVFRRVLQREPLAPPWRRLLRMLWRMEARGQVRGGRFVEGFAGEQFALPEAVGLLRSVRDEDPTGRLIAVSAADPLNLTGLVTPGARIPAVATNRVGYVDGLPACALEGGEIRQLDDGARLPADVRRRLTRRSVPPELRTYVARSG